MKLVHRVGARLLAPWVTTRLPAAGGAIYLTFDDGPHPVHTRTTLDVLETHGASGTFFVIGEQARREPGLCAEIVVRGHALASHSMTHPRMESLDVQAIGREIDEAARVLAAHAPGVRPVFRPPNGKVTVGVLRACAQRRVRVAHWSSDSLDYRLDVPEIVARFRVHPPRPGDVVLFHDDGDRAARALSILLPNWRAAGLRAIAWPGGPETTAGSPIRPS